MACETLLTTGTIVIAGEITSSSAIDYQALARQVVNEIGYDNGEYYFDGNAVGVHVIVDKQSPDIAQGVDTAHDSRVGGSEDPLDRIGAGDQGMMFGYATNETPEYMPAPDYLGAPAFQEAVGGPPLRRAALPAAGWQDPGHRPLRRQGQAGRIEKVLISTQHQDGVESKLPDALWTEVVLPVLPEGMYDPEELRKEFYCNPTGRFVIGGPVGDTGLTGRKIIVDTYGGFARHGGGAFSGKDPSKVDRSAAYAARYVAKNLVAAGLADRAEVQVAYAIGVARPLSLLVETFGTEKISRERIVELVDEHFDLRPGAIVRDLDLRRPIYRPTAAYGHFGRTEGVGFNWERTDKAAALKAAAGL